MKIVDLTEDKKDLFCLCLEDWSDDAKEAGPNRREWLDRSERLGLRAKLALEDDGVEGGLIQYGPIEHSMVASWFKKHGYRKADRQGISVLLWKPFADGAQPPRWFPKVDRRPEPIPGKVNVTAFTSGWCLAQNLVCERAKRAAAELGDAVVFREIDTSERSAVAEWGRCDAVLVDGKNLQKGPPPNYEKIHKAIGRRVHSRAR